MRVTKLIKDYITDEINKKYEEAISTIGKDYHDSLSAFQDEINALKEATAQKAKEIASKYNLVYSELFNTDYIVRISANAENREIVRQINTERDEKRRQRDKLIHQTLLDLELGETNKNELKEILDRISF